MWAPLICALRSSVVGWITPRPLCITTAAQLDTSILGADHGGTADARILVVDDDEQLAALLVLVLEGEGYP